MSTTRARHVPTRTCVACRTSGDKRGLLRVVRSPSGDVTYDPSGKANGRGAYVCAQELCIAQAMKRKAFDRQLKVTVSESVHADLAAAARSLAAPTPDP